MLYFTAYSSFMGSMRACSVQSERVVGSEAGFFEVTRCSPGKHSWKPLRFISHLILNSFWSRNFSNSDRHSIIGKEELWGPGESAGLWSIRRGKHRLIPGDRHWVLNKEKGEWGSEKDFREIFIAPLEASIIAMPVASLPLPHLLPSLCIPSSFCPENWGTWMWRAPCTTDVLVTFLNAVGQMSEGTTLMRQDVFSPTFQRPLWWGGHGVAGQITVRGPWSGAERAVAGRGHGETQCPRHCFMKWVPNPHCLFFFYLPVLVGFFFLTLLRAAKEIKDVIIVKAYILSLVQNWQHTHPCGSGFESTWGGPPGSVP